MILNTRLPAVARRAKEGHPLLVLALVLVLARAAPAVTVDMTLDAEARLTSAHLWRGRVIHSQPAFQPSLTLNAGPWMFNAWGTWDMTLAPDTWERARMDGTLEYTWTGDRQIASAGIVAYVYHDGLLRETRDTFELFASGTMDVMALPTITVYYDFELIKGFYGSLSIGHTFAVYEDMVQLDLGLYVGAASGNYNNHVFGPVADAEGEDDAEETDFGFSLVDLTATAEAPIYVWENVAIVPAIKLMTLLDRDIAEASRDETEPVVTVAYSLGFLAHF